MRFPIPLFTITAALATASSCAAGGLFGSNSTPYAVGYAPVTAPATAVAVPNAVVTGPAVAAAPVAGSYAAGYSPYGAGYTPARTPYLGVAPTATMAVSTPTGTIGAYQAQRPSYVDNPSVYTGRPVTGNVQTSYRAPLTTAPVTTAFPAASYQAGYAAAYPGAVQPTQSVPVTASTGIPATAVAAPAVPVYPSTPPPSSGGCLSRFCQKLFGTGYTTSYYRAPVTYYRPVTTISPTSGTAVTVQQPCTAYEQQMQRTPFTTFQPSPLTPPPSNCGSANCGTPNCAPSAMNSCSAAQPAFGTPAPTQFGAPPSGIGQVNALGSGDSQTVPIPSIPPAGQGYPSSSNQNLSPLTGTPPTLAPPSFGQYQPSTPPAAAPPIAPPAASAPPVTPGSTGDMSPVDKPSLNKAPTNDSSTNGETNPTTRPPSYWQLQNAEDSTAMIPPRTAPNSDPASLSGGYGTAQPIRAPSDYVAPFGRTQAPTSTANTPIAPPPTLNSTTPSAPAATPSLPRPEYDPSDMTSVSHRRYPSTQTSNRASSPNSQVSPAARAQPRDTTWISIN